MTTVRQSTVEDACFIVPSGPMVGYCTMHNKWHRLTHAHMYIVNGDGNVLCDEMYCHALRARREANKVMSLMVENGGGMITTTGLNRDHYDGHEWWEYKRHSVWAGIEE